jgi:DNA polymerase-3 subunit beta
VVFAASPDESRPVLAGVVFIVEDGNLTLVATDSYRLAEAKMEISKGKDIMVVVPARTIHELIRVIGDHSGEIDLKFSKTEAVFEVGDVSIVSRLIDGKFPNYKQIIPAQAKTEVVAERVELLNIVKVASIFARENANTIKMEFKNNTIAIASSAASVGENSSSMDVKMTGVDGEISLNARYLIDVLSALKCEQVSIGMNDKLDPCRLRPVQKGKADSHFTHIIMPLRS